MIDSSIQRQLSRGDAWVGPDLIHPHDGLLRALRAAGDQRPAFVEALRQRLGSTDLRQRTGAIAALREILPDIGADRALAALHSAPLLPGTAPAWRIDHADLEQSAAVALAAAVTARDPNTLAWLKQLATTRPYRVFLLAAIAGVDPDWILANTGLVSHKNLAVLAALPEPRRAALIAALSPWPPEAPSVLTRSFWSRLPPAEASRLRSLMWPQ
jgi:hypothetical protein